MTGSIYELTEPNSGRCRFIGSTTNIQRTRHRHFFTAAYGANQLLFEWVKSLAERNELPEFIVLESGVPVGDLRSRKLEWIRRKISDGNNLHNRVAGGATRADLSLATD